MRTNVVISLLLLSTTIVFAQFKKSSFMIEGNTLPYQVSFPENYDESKQYPLIVFLHGAGERGDDNEKQLTHGADFLINNTQTAYPAIVIAPQCPVTTYWSNLKSNNIAGKRTMTYGLANGASDESTVAMRTLVFLIEDWLQSGRVDKNQVYVGGLSMGGMGTFELLWRMPNTFAAAFPICGGGDTTKADLYAKNTAIWVFHGEADSVVPVENSLNMVDALKTAGGDVKYTGYPDVNHNSWDNVFRETEFFSWLFSHKSK